MNTLTSIKVKHTGFSQSLLKADDFPATDETEVLVGKDGRVYETVGGLLTCIVPRLVKGRGGVFLEKMDWESFPPLGELAHLRDKFFMDYEREVIMLIGQLYDPVEGESRFFYFVPPQEGTGGGVEWSSKEGAIDEFNDKARWIGTIHSHPGKCANPSSIDINEWADPLSTGAHVIFGRTGNFTINGAVQGCTFPLINGSLNEVTRICVAWRQSGGQSLALLLKTPAIPMYLKDSTTHSIITRKGGSFVEDVQRGPRLFTPYDSEGFPVWDVSDVVDYVGGFKIAKDDLPALRLVREDNQVFILTSDQLEEMMDLCHGEDIIVPRFIKKLKVFLPETS